MGLPVKISVTPITGLHLVETTPYADARGSFMRLFCERELAALIEPRRILQSNYSRTSALGAVRGLHFQYPPYAEMKLVRCLRGRVWDLVAFAGSQNHRHQSTADHNAKSVHTG